MNRALCTIKDEPHYRRKAFVAGLKAVGFEVFLHTGVPNPRPGDALIIWNRYARGETLAEQFERAGAAVIIAENGFVGASYDNYAKPYTRSGDQLYALALGQHNGAGQWWVGDPGRWRAQGIHVSPWRRTGNYVLVMGQRGIGPKGVAMPSGWPQKAVERLKKMTKRPVRLRKHPGNVPAVVPLEADLVDAWAVVTWGSGAALKAICAGVPVFSDFPFWIGRRCSFDFGGDIESPLRDDWARETMLDRVAWAQWTVSELSTGEPFERLMDLYREQRKAA